MQVPAWVVPQLVRKELEAVEQQHGVSVLYACEIGRRAWGFTAQNSAFDVGFIFCYGPDDYLSITDRPDQIRLPLSDQLEITGYDIRKALRHFLHSNPEMYEWLQSPLVYHQMNGFVPRLLELAPAYFSLRSGLHYYLGQTRHFYDKELQGPEVNPSRYFYALRTLLAFRWIGHRRSIPPMVLSSLLDVLKPEEQEVRQVLDELVVKKAVTDDETLAPSNKTLNSFIGTGIAEGLALIPAVPIQQGDPILLDKIFREIISEAALLKQVSA